jgi:hypothetical protein
MGPRDVKCTVEVEEEIAQITSTLARANNSWSWMAWIEFVKEEKLYLGVNFLRQSAGRNRFLNLERLNPNALKDPAFPVPRDAFSPNMPVARSCSRKVGVFQKPCRVGS